MQYIRNKYSAFIPLFRSFFSSLLRSMYAYQTREKEEKKKARINLTNSMKFPHMPLLPRSIVVIAVCCYHNSTHNVLQFNFSDINNATDTRTNGTHARITHTHEKPELTKITHAIKKNKSKSHSSEAHKFGICQFLSHNWRVLEIIIAKNVIILFANWYANNIVFTVNNTFDITFLLPFLAIFYMCQCHRHHHCHRNRLS